MLEKCWSDLSQSAYQSSAISRISFTFPMPILKPPDNKQVFHPFYDDIITLFISEIVRIFAVEDDLLGDDYLKKESKS